MHFQFSRSWIFVTRYVTGPRASQKCFFVLATSHSHVSTVYAYSGGRALLQAIGLWLEQSCNHLINSLDQQNALLGFSLIDDVNPPRSLMRIVSVIRDKREGGNYVWTSWWKFLNVFVI